jgi:hypothetical protein
MRKLAIVALGAICAPVLLATSALAQSNLPPPHVVPPPEVVPPPQVQPPPEVLPPPEVAAEVVGAVRNENVVVAPGSRAGARAFTGTGTQITVWMVAAAALLLLGVGLLIAARQRAKRARP